MKTAALIFFGIVSFAYAGADEDWKKILDSEKGPAMTNATTDSEFTTAVATHLELQENQLANFIKTYPTDARVVGAKIRLAHLYVTQGAMQENSAGASRAEKLLGSLATQKLSEKQKADLDFAQISIFMRSRNFSSASHKEILRGKALEFQKAHPMDRRVVPLFIEVAALFDDKPREKEKLLRGILSFADTGSKRRIEDDLKRIGFLGKPLQLKFTSISEEPVDVENMRGSVIVICFFADWSPPSMSSVQEVLEKTKRYSGKVRIIGVSLDDQKETLLENLRAYGVDWPVYFDGKSWLSPLVRNFGLNTLPTVWLLDRSGNLRTLNAAGNLESALRELVAEK